MTIGVSNAQAKQAISGRFKTSEAIPAGVFVKRAAAGTIAIEDTHNAASHGVAIEKTASGAFGHTQRFGVVWMSSAAPIEAGQAIRSSAGGLANRKTVTGELAIDSSLGLDGEITATIDDNEAIKWTSSHADDVGKYLLIIAVDTDDSTVKKELIGPLVAANTEVSGTILWSGTACGGAFGAILCKGNDPDSPIAAVGAITIRSATTETTLATIAAASISMGALLVSKKAGHHGVSAGGGTVTAVSDGVSTKYVIYYGINDSGAEAMELEQLNGVTPVTSTASFEVLTYIVMGDVEVAQTITYTAQNDTTNTTKGYAVSDTKGRNGKFLVDLVVP